MFSTLFLLPQHSISLIREKLGLFIYLFFNFLTRFMKENNDFLLPFINI